VKLREFYLRAVKKAMKDDPRPLSVVRKDLSAAKKARKALRGAEKSAFDADSLSNPYADSRILYGTGNEEIRTVLVGIDIDVQEILLADRLREKGQKIDLIIAHHPSGRAFAGLDKVMPLQSGIWETLGLEKSIAHGVMKERMEEVARDISSRNHMRAVDAARLLGIPFMCLHTAGDNCVNTYLQGRFDKERPAKLKDIMNILKSIPEYKYAMKTGSGPYILVGEEKSDTGKILVDMTGGTNGPDRVFSRLSQSGVKTIVGMHIRDSGFKTVKSEFMNYVVAGHISSDTLGLNLLFDAIDPRGTLEFIECSGFKRFRR